MTLRTASTTALIVLLSSVSFSQFLPEKVISNMDVSISSAPADIDNDGDEDLLHVSYAYEGICKVSYYLNDGNGNFGSEVVISTEVVDPRKIMAADLDNDGLIDAVTISQGDKKVAWYKNNGGGSFGSQQVIDVLQSLPYDMDMDDFDSDGDLDLVVVDYFSLQWYENTGNGNFSAANFLATMSFGSSVECGDFDGNGTIDIASSNKGFGDKVSWLENSGNGVFGTEHIIITTSADPAFIHANDLDNDGDLDFLICYQPTGGAIGYVENTGAGSYSGINMPLPCILVEPNWIQTADINGDAFDDIVLGGKNSTTALEILFNQGNLSFNYSYIPVKSSGYRSFLDADNDGDIDIVNSGSIASTSKMQINTLFKNDGAGNFAFGQSINSPYLETAKDATPGDLDGDGDLDIIATSWEDSTIVLYENQGSGNFSAQTFITTFNAVETASLDLGDLDNDGDLDILIGSGTPFNGGWVENLSNFNFGPIQELPGTPFSWEVKIADLNGDALNDLVFALATADSIVWCENLGSGSFSSPQEVTGLVNLPFSIAVEDMDNDGDLDVVSSDTDDKLSWYENNGSGIFGPQNIIALVPFIRRLKTADLDNDGWQDIVYASFTGTKLAWCKNLGGGNFGSEQPISAPLEQPDIFTIFDADNDGDQDITAISNIDEILLYYENFGNGVFSQGTEFNSSFQVGNRVRHGDLDNDGDIDLIHAAGPFGKVSWFGSPVNTPYQVKGQMYVDLNQNSIRDTLEPGMFLSQITSTPLSDFAFVSQSGNFFLNFSNPLSNSYTIAPSPLNNWSITTDSTSYTVQISNQNNAIDSLDFGFFPNVFFDSVHIEPVNSFAVCDDTINYWLYIGNEGTTEVAGVVSVSLDDSVTFISSTPAPDSIIGNDVYWSYDSLALFEYLTIPIQVEMPGFSIGSNLLMSQMSHYFVDSSGAFSDTSYALFNHNLVCAYDPNDKIAVPAGIGTPGYIDPGTDYIDYTIRFQNTGTYFAEDVVIKDQLDTNLIWNSITPLAHSHDMEISMDPSGEISFIFNNIQLVDSSVSQTESQGFVKYRIYLKPNLPLGTEIFNTARIYFDQNPAIYTNTKTHTLYDCPSDLQSIVPATPICFGDSITFEVLLDSTLFNWSIPGVVDTTGTNLTWQADSSGTFNTTLQFSNNLCTIDSSFQLTILDAPVPVELPIISNCFGDSLLIFGTYRSTSGIFYDTLSNLIGCDSIIAQELIVLPQVPVTQLADIQICPGDSVFIFGNSYEAPGTYYDTISNINQCDSVIGINLTYYPSYNQAPDSLTICSGDSSLIFGQFQSIPGLYIDSVLTVNGCDSVLKIYLSTQINQVSFGANLPDTICVNASEISLNGGSPNGGIYSGAGVTNNIFSPSMAGPGAHVINYSHIDSLGCSGVDSTLIYVDNCASIEELDIYPLLAFPNPFTSTLVLAFNSKVELDVSISVFNVLGQEVLKVSTKTTDKYLLDCSKLASGSYRLQIKDTENKVLLLEKMILKIAE